MKDTDSMVIELSGRRTIPTVSVREAFRRSEPGLLRALQIVNMDRGRLDRLRESDPARTAEISRDMAVAVTTLRELYLNLIVAAGRMVPGDGSADAVWCDFSVIEAEASIDRIRNHVQRLMDKDPCAIRDLPKVSAPKGSDIE